MRNRKNDGCFRGAKRPGVSSAAEPQSGEIGIMRGTGSICWIMTLVSLVAFASTAEAAHVQTLGVGRGYDNGTYFQSVMTGASMSTIRAHLMADGHTFASTETLSAQTLAGADILFLGLFDPSESLSPAERSAVESFVRAGGALVYMGDNDLFSRPNASVGGIFGITFSGDPTATSAANVMDSAHPIMNGIAGRATVYEGSGNLRGFFGGMDSLGAYARAVLRSDARTCVAAIERGALQPGSGAVVFLAEANGFLNTGIGTVEQGSNIILMRNIFSFAAGIGPQDCTSDAECADGNFCNGMETCVGGECREGFFPCAAGLGCHEATDTCGPCQTNDECDDGRFCNGSETCTGGECMPGAFPCAAGQGCHEGDDACGPCDDDSQCDDGLFCNGEETCNDAASCDGGEAPCDDECLFCDEIADVCSPCILDLDSDGFIGTGDFAFFAGCFGACYPLNHPCLLANFDESTDGCVGTGDFAAFSGCFGASCGECGNCDPIDSAVGSQTASTGIGADIRLIAVSQPYPNDQSNELPLGGRSFVVGTPFFVEVWVSRNNTTEDGLAAVYTTLGFDASLFVVDAAATGSTFQMFENGAIDAVGGKVDTLGGCADLGESRVGVDPLWARVATLRVQGIRTGTGRITAESSGPAYGVAVFGKFGNLDPNRIRFGSLELMLLGGPRNGVEPVMVPTSSPSN